MPVRALRPDRYARGVLWADCQEQEAATIAPADLWATQHGVLQLPGDDLRSKSASWRSLVSGLEVAARQEEAAKHFFELVG